MHLSLGVGQGSDVRVLLSHIAHAIAIQFNGRSAVRTQVQSVWDKIT